MPTFTTIVYHEPEFGVAAYDVGSVIRQVQTTLLSQAARGAKCHQKYEPLQKPEDEGRYLLVTITLQNMKGTLLDKALIIGEQPLIARPAKHAWGGAPIQCKACGHMLFYYIDRSLDYENHICAQCDTPAHTITETGASA
jgi:hypothetical protein